MPSHFRARLFVVGVSVGIVAFMSLNLCCCQRVLALFITLFIPCSASLYFGCATHMFLCSSAAL